MLDECYGGRYKLRPYEDRVPNVAGPIYIFYFRWNTMKFYIDILYPEYGLLQQHGRRILVTNYI
jgi:hypothetical protein